MPAYVHQTHRRHSIRAFWLVSAALFIGGFLTGMYAPGHLATTLLQQLQTASKNIVHDGALVTIVGIFLHNAMMALMMIAFGTLAGIIPAIWMWSNGLIVGYVTSILMARTHAPEIKIILVSFLPHGIFEITALLWAAALGLHLGFTAIQSVARAFRETRNSSQGAPTIILSWWTELIYTAKRVPYIVALLLIAACIESIVTPWLIQSQLM